MLYSDNINRYVQYTDKIQNKTQMGQTHYKRILFRNDMKTTGQV